MRAAKDGRSPRRMKVLALVAALGGFLVLLLPPATANASCSLTADDRIYIEVLAERGLYNTGGDCSNAAAGRSIARDIDLRIRTPIQEAIYVYHNTPSSIGMDDAAYMVGAAIAAYAPWDLYMIDASLSGSGTGGGGPTASTGI